MLGGSNLAQADLFGKSDPYVRVFLQDTEQGRTKTIDNTLDPNWDDPAHPELFDIFLPPTRSLSDLELRLEIWDADVGKGQFLGHATLRGKSLLNLAFTVEMELREIYEISPLFSRMSQIS